MHDRIYQITGHAQNQYQEQYDDHDQDPGAVIRFPAIVVEAACPRILPYRSHWIRWPAACRVIIRNRSGSRRAAAIARAHAVLRQIISAFAAKARVRSVNDTAASGAPHGHFLLSSEPVYPVYRSGDLPVDLSVDLSIDPSNDLSINLSVFPSRVITAGEPIPVNEWFSPPGGTRPLFFRL